MSSSNTKQHQLIPKGTELSNDDRSIVPWVEAQIQALDLTDESKELIRTMLKKPVKMTVPEVMSIWEIAADRRQIFPGLQSKILWVEGGSAGKAPGERKGGYKHILDHAPEFERLGIHKEELVEVAEAVTSLGTFVGMQNQGKPRGKNREDRPVLLLLYKDIPLAVAISVGSNGFVVGMNHQSFANYMAKGPTHINDVARWKSADGDIDPTNPSFHGWVLQWKSESHPECWKYIKVGEWKR